VRNHVKGKFKIKAPGGARLYMVKFLRGVGFKSISRKEKSQKQKQKGIKRDRPGYEQINHCEKKKKKTKGQRSYEV